MATLFVKIFPRNLQHIEISAIAKRKPSAEKVGQPARAKRVFARKQKGADRYPRRVSQATNKSRASMC